MHYSNRNPSNAIHEIYLNLLLARLRLIIFLLSLFCSEYFVADGLHSLTLLIANMLDCAEHLPATWKGAMNYGLMEINSQQQPGDLASAALPSLIQQKIATAGTCTG